MHEDTNFKRGFTVAEIHGFDDSGAVTPARAQMSPAEELDLTIRSALCEVSFCLNDLHLSVLAWARRHGCYPFRVAPKTGGITIYYTVWYGGEPRFKNRHINSQGHCLKGLCEEYAQCGW